MARAESEQKQFQKNPALFLEGAIKKYLASRPENRLEAFNNEPIFDEPLVGFADGDDPIFQEYKAIIGDFHLTPREALGKYLQSKGVERRRDKVSVIAWVLPIAGETRLSNRRENLVASLRWNHTRWLGQDFLNQLAGDMLSLLEGLGRQAVAPDLADFRETRELANGPASNWSHKHIAYAAGLGTFGLHATLITSKGAAMRCGSIVTDMALPPTPRVYENHLANCLFYSEGSCRRCIKRCPVEALSQQGFDKKKCRNFIYYQQGSILHLSGGGEGYIGRFPACGLCQTKVPCEDRIPPSILHKNQQ